MNKTNYIIIPCHLTKSILHIVLYFCLFLYFQLIYEPELSNPDKTIMEVVAIERTWANQRRKRREARRKKGDEETSTADSLTKDTAISPNSSDVDSSEPKTTVNMNIVTKQEEKDTESRNNKRKIENTQEDIGESISDDAASSHNSQPTKKIRKENVCADSNGESEKIPITDHGNIVDISIEDISDYVLKCKLTVKKVEEKDNIQLEILWVDGEKKEYMHQLLQLLKNKIK